MTMLRKLLLALAAVALLTPAILAHHTPPGYNSVDAGNMKCGQDSRGGIFVTGTANTQTLPILRTTDNGHLNLYASGTADNNTKCKFAVQITGYNLVGINPMGAAVNIVNAPCIAVGPATCTATADADWWVNFVGPNPTSNTWEIDINFDLLVNGITVDTGVVRIIEPSLPPITLP